MPRLVIISNRLPVTIDRKEGELIYYSSAGGLATGLNSLENKIERVWIGWPGQAVSGEQEQDAIREDLLKDNLYPVFLTEEEIQNYYEGFSNKVIWPHFHYFTQFTTYDEVYWEAYKKVNQKFSDEVIKHVRKDDLIWIHDYQLLLLPALIRESFPSISIGFFLHIPFPSYEVFRILPWRKEILQGVLGADLVGFHTFGYMRHFLSASYRIAGYEHNFGQLTVGHRLVNVDVFPMGIDYDKFSTVSSSSIDKKEVKKIRRFGKNRKLILSIDRLDYTKGIPQRIKAFSKFLAEFPEYRGKVSLILVVVPSRSNLPQYQELKHEVDTLVGEINGTYAMFDWIPIHYQYRSLNFGELSVLYREADIAMITPLRDGMNLVAKEYIASKEKSKRGVLILSEMAGVANELSDALLVNPQDMNDIVKTLLKALEMSEKEQKKRLEKMQVRLKKYNVAHWANAFMNEQIQLRENRNIQITNVLSEEVKVALIKEYRDAQKRLLIFDYDGTLMAFHENPKAVVPDRELIRILEHLSSSNENKVIISSGRDRHTLDKWLGELDIDMAAEHGVWRKHQKQWRKASGLLDHWKGEVRTVLEYLVERTPGSFIEEKEYSVAWHYRRIDKDLGEKRVREFRDVLLYLTANLDLQVLEGNKVVEIKNAGVNKGKAISKWLGTTDWDFVLVIGDDHTDEDMFLSVPPSAFSIKVGLENTAARFNVISVHQVRELLKELVAAT